jgi:AI-2E family transporter
MQTPKGKTAATDALVGLWAVALTSFVIATLYFARDFLIPLALAALLTFLLSPLVARIERWLGRIAAVLLVGAMIFAATGVAGWVLTRQLVDLATKLPDYKENIQTKLRSIKVPTGGVFTKFSKTVEELKKDLPGAETPTQAVDRRCNTGSPLVGRLAQLDDAASDDRPFRRARTIEQQCHGTLALWLEHRSNSNCAHRRCGILDMALGSCRAHSLDAAYGLPRRHGATRSAPFISQRSTKR